MLPDQQVATKQKKNKKKTEAKEDEIL